MYSSLESFPMHPTMSKKRGVKTRTNKYQPRRNGRPTHTDKGRLGFYVEHDGQLLIVSTKPDPGIPEKIYTGYSVTITAGQGRQAALVNTRVPVSLVRVHERYLSQLCSGTSPRGAMELFMRKFHRSRETQGSTVWDNLMRVVQKGFDVIQKGRT